MKDITNPISKNRIDLRREIPLAQPTKVCIDPVDMCNFKCDFCGLHSKRNHFDMGKVMSLELFEIVVKQLLEFPNPIKQVHLYALGEPLINPNIVEFVRILKEKKVSEEVIIVSNGSLLTNQLSEKLVEVGLDELRISVNGLSDEDYYRITGVKLSFEKLYNEICYYHQIKGKIHVKILGDYFTENQKKQFVELFSDHCDTLNIANVIKNMNDQQFDVDISGKNQHGFVYENSGKMVCPQMFYELVIHPNGEVGPCSADYNYSIDTLGNVKNITLKEIWFGKRLNEMRVASLKGDSVEYGNCGSCNFAKDGATVNLTPYRLEILDRMLQNDM